jgi:hypothetical protein
MSVLFLQQLGSLFIHYLLYCVQVEPIPLSCCENVVRAESLTANTSYKVLFNGLEQLTLA